MQTSCVSALARVLQDLLREQGRLVPQGRRRRHGRAQQESTFCGMDVVVPGEQRPGPRRGRGGGLVSSNEEGN